MLSQVTPYTRGNLDRWNERLFLAVHRMFTRNWTFENSCPMIFCPYYMKLFEIAVKYIIYNDLSHVTPYIFLLKIIWGNLGHWINYLHYYQLSDSLYGSQNNPCHTMALIMSIDIIKLGEIEWLCSMTLSGVKKCF